MGLLLSCIQHHSYLALRVLFFFFYLFASRKYLPSTLHLAYLPHFIIPNPPLRTSVAHGQEIYEQNALTITPTVTIKLVLSGGSEAFYFFSILFACQAGGKPFFEFLCSIEDDQTPRLVYKAIRLVEGLDHFVWIGSYFLFFILKGKGVRLA